MTDQLQELAELREQTDVLLQQTTLIHQQLDPVEATDESGQVRVKIDAEGAITAVSVGFSWERAISREQLVPAVVEAVTTASMRRMEQYGEAASAVEAQPAPRARPVAPSEVVAELGERFAAAPDEGRAAEQFLTEVLAEASEGLEEANRLLAEHAERIHTERSGPGHVTASLNSSGSLTALEIDQRWLRTAHPTNLGREITEAIARATTRARREGLTAALNASKLAQLAARTTGYAAHPHRED